MTKTGKARYPYELIKQIAIYMIKNKCSLREVCAKEEFKEIGISKSCIDGRFHTELKKRNPEIYSKLEKVLCHNRLSGPLKGGLCIKLRFEEKNAKAKQNIE